MINLLIMLVSLSLCSIIVLEVRYTGCFSTYVTNFFLGIPHPKISKKVPINMGPKMNRFQDIQCCVEI